MPIKTVIFDLDGTLIDSSKSILAGFAGAFAAEGRQPVRPLTADVIGPPLKATLALLAGSDDPVLIERLADQFKAHYDSEGYKKTTVFEGVPEMLATLHERGVPLHIATNKRLLPTQKILAHLGWIRFFGCVRALDAWSPAAAHKADMIGRQLGELNLTATDTIYVGDRKEDADAAAANGMPFAFAAWGYGAPPTDIEATPLQTPADLQYRV